MNQNNITIEIYRTGTTIEPDLSGELDNAEQLNFVTGYPGGLYLNGSFFVPRDVTMPWPYKSGMRVVFRNGLRIVYEGYISSFDYEVGVDTQGVRVNLESAWARYLMQRRWGKIWSDTRTDEKTWQIDLTRSEPEEWLIDRTAHIHVSPNTTGLVNTDALRLVYIPPDGQTIKRISYDYNYSEYAGMDFTMKVQYYASATWADVGGSSVSATGTGSHDIDISATPGERLGLVLLSNKSQNPTVDHHTHAEWSKLCVYTELGTIDLPEVIKDIRGKLTDINATEVYISALASARSLCGSVSVPATFGGMNFESMADIITQAASPGDGNNSRYAIGFYHSETSPSPDGKPVIYSQIYPVLTSWDVSVRLDDLNLSGDIQIRQKFDEIRNYIIVRYSDDNGFAVTLTPTDDASLKDQTSINAYGQRDAVLDLGYCSATVAAQTGYRFLAARKDPQFELLSPVTVSGKIRTLSGEFAPVSQTTAGQRLRIENFLNDLTGQAQGATFLISSTNYDDTNETVTITCGPPPDLIFPQMVAPVKIQIEETYTYEAAERTTPDIPDRTTPDMSGGTSGGGGKRVNLANSDAYHGKAEKTAWEKGWRKKT